jgi:pimeloyl-ACP methyl ester carboxylesterase
VSEHGSHSIHRSASAARPAGADPLDPPEPAARLRVRSADGTNLNVEIHGPDGAPTVVLVHGWTCSIPFWAAVIRELATDAAPDDRLRVVAYDQRGHGGSDIPGRGFYSVQALVDDLVAVLDATLPAGQKAVLAGHSMGGMAVMAAAENESVLSRTCGAVLASTGFRNLPAASRVFPLAGRLPRYSLAAHRYMLHSTMPLGPVTPVTRAQLKYTALGPKASKHLARVNARIIQACRPGPRSGWGRVLSGLDLSAAVPLLDVPTSVVFGTKDRLTPTPHAHEIAAALPQCTGLTLLPGLGHMTPMEAPDTVAGLIRERIAAAGRPGQAHETTTHETTQGAGR